jgi:hypothetical protein
MSAQAGGEMTEQELRAYEAELSQITSGQLLIQAAASLLNVGGRRLGLGPGAEGERDLDQVCDSIDAVMALLPILERRMPAAQARPLRDALSQLQMAYARLAQEQPAAGAPASEAQPGAGEEGAASSAGARQAASSGKTQPVPDSGASDGGDADQKQGPGPAERSGRLWVPGR